MDYGQWIGHKRVEMLCCTANVLDHYHAISPENTIADFNPHFLAKSSIHSDCHHCTLQMKLGNGHRLLLEQALILPVGRSNEFLHQH